MAILDNTLSPNPAPQPFWNTALRYGGLCGLAMMVYGLLVYLFSVNLFSIAGFLIHLLIVLGISVALAAVAVKYQRDTFDGGYIAFGRAFLLALVTIAMGVVISTTWNYLFVNFLAPGYVNDMQDMFTETWGDKMPAEQLEKSLEDFGKMTEIGANLKNMATGSLFLGSIGGLIAAAIMRRNKPVE